MKSIAHTEEQRTGLDDFVELAQGLDDSLRTAEEEEERAGVFLLKGGALSAKETSSRASARRQFRSNRGDELSVRLRRLKKGFGGKRRK